MKTTVLILCGLFSAMSTLSALPAAAADLKAKRDAKVAEIDRVYAAELDKLQRRLMADGNLASANEVEDEIKRVSVNPFADEKPKVASSATQTVSVETPGDERLAPLVGVWKRDSDNGIWNITNTTGGTFNGKRSFTMSFDAENKRVAVIGSNWADHLILTSDPDVVNGTTKINGKTVRYKLKRVK